jgi:Tol biopolymer transport system component
LAIACTNPDTQQQDLWVYDLARSSKSRFAPVANWQGFQLWSPDDREITFVAVGESETQRLLYRRDADGLRAAEKILGPASYISPYDWSRDGRRLIYGVAPTVWSRDGRRLIYGVSTTASKLDLWILPLEDGGKPYPFLESDYSARFASFSPDGRFVAFSWSPSGQDEVYVRPLDRSKNRQWQVSMDGGTQPRWSNDGKQIYFLSTGRKLMSAAVKVQGDEFVSAAPVAIMPLPWLPFTFSGYLYDVSPRGDRVLFIRTSTTRGSTPIRMILNWEGLLKP